MSLVERLGYKTLKNLHEEMTNNDIMEWVAYDKTQNDEWRKHYLENLHLENQRTQSLEEEAEKMMLMFMGLN